MKDITRDNFKLSLQCDKSMLAKVVEAYSRQDIPQANVFDNELAEMRKMEKTVINTRLALE